MVPSTKTHRTSKPPTVCSSLYAATEQQSLAADSALSNTVSVKSSECGFVNLSEGLDSGPAYSSASKEHSRRLGHQRVRLDTNNSLTNAIAMYHRNEYAEIERYNDNPYAQRWFEKTLDD